MDVIWRYCENRFYGTYLDNDMQPFNQITVLSADLFEAVFPMTEGSIQLLLLLTVPTAICYFLT